MCTARHIYLLQIPRAHHFDGGEDHVVAQRPLAVAPAALKLSELGAQARHRGARLVVGRRYAEADGGHHALLTRCTAHAPLQLLTVVQQQALVALGNAHLFRTQTVVT